MGRSLRAWAGARRVTLVSAIAAGVRSKIRGRFSMEQINVAFDTFTVASLPFFANTEILIKSGLSSLAEAARSQPLTPDAEQLNGDAVTVFRLVWNGLDRVVAGEGVEGGGEIVEVGELGL